MSSISSHSYSHTHHFVKIDQFDAYVAGLLKSEGAEKKERLQKLMSKGMWNEIRDSSYWRHNIYNKGLSGPFTEYFATFNPQWNTDFWGAKIQPIDITYLNENAIPKAYRNAITKTKEVLSTRVNELVKDGQSLVSIASLACGTMYDVLEAKYEDAKPIQFHGFDVDGDSLRLAQIKAKALGYQNQIEIHESDVVKTSLKEKHFDIIVCNGFSLYLNDHDLGQVIENVTKALKSNGIFIMSFIQPSQLWEMNEAELKTRDAINEIYAAFPMNWTANFRRHDEVKNLLEKGGLTNVKIFEEVHQIHPLAMGHKE